MAPKRGSGNTKNTVAGVIHDEEWVSSLMGEMELNGMLEAGILPDGVTVRWRPTNGEPYPMPHTNKVIIFEDYFCHGLGLSIHPFLHDLLEY